ncbi:TonB-dependent receptor [Flavivirga abyssicola]|uniref:SusC/RagA family TonB-linked outer membrane protein n=1 Tax=Flavivirga abyssicola TaxID=3063533 RepID=UPI0026DFC956|nr:TonB-dependent receptor [Flavivirga sp. MEBiC07777]WVK12648.1 TonB-dependent receptor [Flavivirga sp. MEBiC07777]
MIKTKLKILTKHLAQLFLLVLCLGMTAHGQTRVTGTVEDESGIPIAGVNIIEIGTQNGVVTGFDGNFEINLVNSPSELLFTFLGYKDQKKTVSGNENLKIIIQEDLAQLDEIVVVGYGTAKRSDLTGALTSVSSKDFDKQPLNDVSQALQGRAAGVQVTQTSGVPGGAFKIRIRGANSITGSNEPLYVVDGQFVDISTINVNDIASMEVLKDASSTAIYGTRGANGVVLITTKKGRTGKAKINVDVFTGISNVTQKLDIMNAAEFAEGVNFSDGTEVFTAQEIADLRANGGEDWQELLFQTGYFNNVQISASGGSENVDYYLSGNYYDADGTVINQNFKRLNLRSNLNAKLSERLKVGLNLNLGREVGTGVRADLGVGLSFDPATRAFDEDGNYNFNSTRNLATSQTNPLVAVENNFRENAIDRVSVNANINWDIAKNLVFNTSAGIVKSERHFNTYAPLISSNNGRANVDNIYLTNLFNTNRLTYSVDINENNSLKIDAIHELVMDKFNRVEIDASDFFTDVVSFKDLSAANVQTVQNNENNRDLESFLGRINYSLFNKYLFTASFRADGTSVFQKDKWGYFPSASFAWKISEESFIKNIETINNLKLRLSYGQVGNQGISPFGTRSRAVLNEDINYPFNGTLSTGVAPSNRVANPDLTWETTEQINTGFDLGLLNSAITLSFDYYKKNTTDLLLDTQLPQFVGPTRKFVNAGEVENNGFEITLGTRILQNDNWRINSTLSLSSNKNKVLSLNDDLEFLVVGDEIRANTFPVNPTRVEVGLPISTFRGYIFEGVYQIGEEAEAAIYNKVPGDAKYRDINNDDAITTDDITTVGDGNADFTWGWNWDVGYKNWNLNFVLTGSQGNDIYNLQRARLMALGAQQFHAVHGDYRNRWTPNNPSNIPSGRDGTEILSSQFIEDGSYITMKNIALSYNVDTKLLGKLGLSSARLYTSVENLFTITDYSGFDPEATASVSNQDADVGIDYNTYPINRSVTFGLNVTF